MSTAPPAGAAEPVEPHGPTERLSVVRLGIVVLIVVAVVGVAFTGVRRAVANAQPRAKSWSVPYVDVTLSPTYQFQDPQSNPSRDVALAFVVADPQKPCQPSWGGAYTLDQAGDALDLDRRIDQLRSAGGDVMISFGGLTNTELAVSCTDQGALESAYRAVIDRYDATVVDIDLEGAALSDTASIGRRVTAIAAIQREKQAAGKQLDVWLTLPVATSGLTADGVGVVRASLQGGVELLGVNAMTMDFGDAQHPTTDMLSASEKALDATATQVGDVYRETGTTLDEAKRWARIGATPMIGQNDVDGEVFTLDDARALVEYAQKKGVARVSTWSLNRDRSCGASFAAVAVHSNTCSGVDQQPLEFASIFNVLPGRAPTAGPTDAITVPDQLPTADDPAHSPYPVWRPTAQYPEGYKVVWHGSVYQAKWYNQGNDPSTVVSSQWQTPWALIGPVSPTDTAPTITTVPTGSLPSWDPTTLYEKGTTVSYDGLPYQARWTTKGDAPSTQFPVGPEAPWKPLFQVPGEPASSE
jgi:chitinase